VQHGAGAYGGQHLSWIFTEEDEGAVGWWFFENFEEAVGCFFHECGRGEEKEAAFCLDWLAVVGVVDNLAYLADLD